MSFQGDVAGIGLGELLQGLARGGRDGVLTLYGSSLSAALGLEQGQLYFLPGPDETDNEWRERANRAWAANPQPELEGAHRHTIAQASRLETMYRMLEAPNLSFKFEPGPLPRPEGAPDAFGQPTTVEYLLLEHARIADESSDGPAGLLSNFDMPRALDPSRFDNQTRDFLLQCDGSSTLQEIADRLGWALTQVRATIARHLAAANVRIASPRELLTASHSELRLGRVGRASTRMAGWVRSSPPGPPTAEDAELLIDEWINGRLSQILRALTARDARALLRKLDVVHADNAEARARWRTVYENHRSDEICLLHEVALRLSAVEEADGRTFHDLLRLARSFQERGYAKRTRTLLRLAANHLPSAPHTRIELGKRMIETGLAEEGTAWLLDTARQLIDQGDPEKAIVPIRTVLRRLPDSNDANALLIETRSLLVKSRRRRWNTASALSVVLVISLVAMIKFRSERRTQERLAIVHANISQPEDALNLLEGYFDGVQTQEIADLRSSLVRLIRDKERKELDAWTLRYREVEEECLFGDPRRGLRQTMELPPPPDHEGSRRSFEARHDLLGLLANRLGEQSEDLDLPVDASQEELKKEERLAILLQDLIVLIDEIAPNKPSPEASSFRFRLDELHAEIVDRRRVRADEREQLFEERREEEQNILLAAARAHQEAGDLTRSLETYERLLETDAGLGDLPIIREEISGVRAHLDAVRTALALAQIGDHEAAAEKLESGVCSQPSEHLLPWKVNSRPQGARVTLPDGRVRVTPFVAQSGVGERVVLSLAHDGYQAREISLTRPKDLVVNLHRFPERSWISQHRIEALPVGVENDHVVADRSGQVMRFDSKGLPKWERKLSSLGGIGRSPVFLPSKPGYLLVLSEDGKAWLINAGTGETSDTLEVGSPPEYGPALMHGGVYATFEDGRAAFWTDRLDPQYLGAADASDAPPFDRGTRAEPANVVSLRSSVDLESVLKSPWTDWTAKIEDNELLIFDANNKGFTADLEGAWLFVAWEAPKALTPLGRLWVSDGQGLRSFLPAKDNLVDLGK